MAASNNDEHENGGRGDRQTGFRPRSRPFAQCYELSDLTGISSHLRLPQIVIVRYNPAQMLGQMLGQGESGAMARKINRLNARAVATITKYGRHADGGGLYLSISPNGGRRWVFLYRWHGKPTEIGLDSARGVTLARARELAGQARAKLAEKINPKDARKPTNGATFGECADRVIEAMRPSWRNGKHAAQWEMTLRDYAAPLRRLPVDQITTDDVVSVLTNQGSREKRPASLSFYHPLPRGACRTVQTDT